MIHQIKALYDNGNGLSKRAIAKQLNTSRNTVRKYLAMDEQAISLHLEETDRQKLLDQHRDYIVHLLQTFPKLSAVKVQRKLSDKFPELAVSDRSIRRYVNNLKHTVCSKQQRYYQPVLDMVPGVQCQVDPGELRDVLINGVETVVHFVVFVLSYSRMMYVALSPKPINTECFIRMHDAAFRYFGGMTQELVYDQTKLVVINETYRELEINARFNEYATHAGFRIHACEGYDPESKGKVEAGVKYVKINALYGEHFEDWSALEQHVIHWLDTVANERKHGTTGEAPRLRYERDEQAHMLNYLTPSTVHQAGQQLTRKVDKTGLISWKTNKYSVPMRYQQTTVLVDAIGAELCVFDSESCEEVARHQLCSGKGQVIKNKHHYRDMKQKVAELEQLISECIGQDYGNALCALLKETEPRIYKDQLNAANNLLRKYSPVNEVILRSVIDRPALSATKLRDFLEAYTEHPERLERGSAHENVSLPETKVLSQLNRYAGLSTQEVFNEYH